jgi:hypothetical protein
MKDDNLLIKTILDSNDDASLQNPDMHAALAMYINDLILNNFQELVYLLYRVDVSEQKLKTLLKENDKSDAGSIIATMMIERQIQKIRSRREHRRDNDIIDENESW